MISKKIIEGKIEFKYLIGSMLNPGGIKTSNEEDNGEDFS